MSTGRKEKIRDILRRRALEELDEWARGSRAPLRTLFSLTYDEEALIRWRAVEALGKTAKTIAERDVEKLRTVIRGFMWLMAEESGGIGWHAPEAIAEILVNVPELMDEYAKLLPQYLEEESFAPGAAAALLRIALLRPKVVLSNTGRILERLGDKDPRTRAFLAAALRLAGGNLPKAALRRLRADEAEVEVYDFRTGELSRASVERIALQEPEPVRILGSNNKSRVEN